MCSGAPSGGDRKARGACGDEGGEIGEMWRRGGRAGRAGASPTAQTRQAAALQGLAVARSARTYRISPDPGGNGARAADLEGRRPKLGARWLAGAAWHWVPVREERDERERNRRMEGRRWEAGGREKGAVSCGGGPAAARQWVAGHQREVGALFGDFPGHLLPEGQGGGVEGSQRLQAHPDRPGVQHLPRSEACC